jgi:hypothetical protein
MITRQLVSQIMAVLGVTAALIFLLRGCSPDSFPCDRATAITVEQCGAVGERP